MVAVDHANTGGGGAAGGGAAAAAAGGAQEQTPVARNGRQRSRSCRSSVWKNFTRFKEDGDVRIKARCNNCNAVLIADSRNGTSSLQRHAKNCKQKADPAVPPSCAPSHPDEHESNQLVVNPSCSDPPPQPYPVSAPAPQTDPSPQRHSNDPAPLLPYYPLSQCDEELPDREHGPEQQDGEEFSNLFAQLAIELHGQDPLFMSHPGEHAGSNHSVVNFGSDPPSSLFKNHAILSPPNDFHGVQSMQLPHSYYQRSPPSASFFDNLHLQTIIPPAPRQVSYIDPPLSVPQTLPCHPPPQPLLPCPLSSHSDDEVLPDCEQGQEDDKESSSHLARLIALHGYDPALVEDDCFSRFLASLNPEFKLPSRLAVEEMCDGIFDETRKDLLSKLSRSPGQVSLAVATAKTIYGEVLYTACHFIDDEWKLHKVVLDAYRVGPLPVLYGALWGLPEVTLDSDCFRWAIDGVVDGISQRGILDKLFMVAWEMGGMKVDSEMQNYMKQKFSKDYGRSVFCNLFMDRTFHLIVERTVPPVDFATEVYQAVEDLDLTRQKRQQFFSRMGLDLEHQWADSKPVWYSLYCSLGILRKEKDGSTLNSTIAGTDTELTEAVFYKIWGEMIHSIQRISAPTSPTSNLCLLEFFKIREALQSELARTTTTSTTSAAKQIADALAFAQAVTGVLIHSACPGWSIALVLDPRYKLTYIKFAFSRAFGSSMAAHHVSKITRRIKNMYTAGYVKYGDGIHGTDLDGVLPDDDSCEGETSHDMEQLVLGLPPRGPQGSIPAPADSFERAWDKHRCSRDDRTEASTSYMDSEKELDRYLEDDLAPDTEDFDILGWWKTHMSEYPTVALMARDVLAMPTSSKLSSEHMAHLTSIIRGYSKKSYKQLK